MGCVPKNAPRIRACGSQGVALPPASMDRRTSVQRFLEAAEVSSNSARGGART